ncbi:primosomal protein N' [Sphaerotilus sp.]|uniref:primosomal protein N' n=1 Tax=Sphaerotilus sp. TaxID=2093942 RepID=UPI0038F74F96
MDIPAPPASPALPVEYRLRVLVDLPRHSRLDAVLDYLAPEPWPAGTLVRVPLGKREVCGIVWGAAEVPEGVEGDEVPVLRSVVQALTALPPFTAGWLRLVGFAASYYQRSPGEVGLSALPPDLRDLDAVQLTRRLKRLDKARAAAAKAVVVPPVPERPALSPEQQTVLDTLADGSPQPSLLFGATGSGKTEVYLREAERVLAAGRQALVLVPEINLTPQLEARFAERFPDRCLVSLHSGLTPAQRLQHWLSAHLGHADLVLGTRMAVFASMPRLGLIVIDEEHDPSYKQQEGARYSARDLAVWRGRHERVPVLLGSATPSLESWYNAGPVEAGGGRYRRLVMPSRIGGGRLPAVRLVDLSRIAAQFGKQALRQHPLAPPLLDALRERLDRGEQSLVLLNRRGYAPVLHCTNCGWKSACPHCSAWRVFHKLDRTLRCHHCGITERVPRACPDCGDPDIQPMGRGTERLEEQLADLLPGARIGRIDADSTRTKGSLESQLASVHAGEVDVLVGTQMVAKGHDFRRMTLVAAVQADAALFSSDFRAPERLFSLLMQAGGRAGRDAELAGRSEVWIQTWHPAHALYAALRQHDYEAFAASQLAERESAGMPPFSFQALLRADARTPEAALAFLDAAALQAQRLPGAQEVLVYPPVPAPIHRVADVERAQMLVEASGRVALHRLLAHWLPGLQALSSESATRVLRWALDVDPLSI